MARKNPQSPKTKATALDLGLESIAYSGGAMVATFNKPVNILFAGNYIAAAYTALSRVEVTALSVANPLQGRLFTDLQDRSKNPTLTLGIGHGTYNDENRHNYYLMQGRIDSDQKRYAILRQNPSNPTDEKMGQFYSHLEKMCKKR